MKTEILCSDCRWSRTHGCTGRDCVEEVSKIKIIKEENMIHELNINNDFFSKVVSLDKKFEVIKNDRNFQVGDLLAMNEVDENGVYTGNSAIARVTYVLNDPNYCKNGTVIISISPCELRDAGDRNELTGRRMEMQILNIEKTR